MLSFALTRILPPGGIGNASIQAKNMITFSPQTLDLCYLIIFAGEPKSFLQTS
jgi:hypothetical protein